MRFLSIVWKNLSRRKSRSFFTAAGVSVGVGVGVALSAIAWGFDKSFEEAYLARGTDAIVAKITRGSVLPGFFDEARAGDLAAFTGIRAVGSMLSDYFSIEGSEGLIVYGWQADSFLWDHLKKSSAQNPVSSRPVWLGVIAAELLGKKAGDALRIKDQMFEVAGVFESDSMVESSAVIVTLPQLQALVGRPGKVNFLNLRLAPGMTDMQFQDLRTAIERKYRGLRLYRAGEVSSSLATVQASKAMSLVTTTIALVIGMLGIMNTILMSIFERSHEIGLLMALGWRRRRVMAMVVSESVVLCIAGAVGGILLGTGAVMTIQSLDLMRGKIAASFTPGLFLAAFTVAAILGILSSLYPAWKAASISPRFCLQST